MVVRASVVNDLRHGLDQLIANVERFDGKTSVLKGRTRETARRMLEVLNQGLRWHPDPRMTPFDRKVMRTVMDKGSSEGGTDVTFPACG